MRKRIIQDLRKGGWTFEELALEIYGYQSKNNQVYREFLDLSGQLYKQVHKIEDIPFLPITFFKSHAVKTGNWTETQKFMSSGTTGSIPSIHYVRDMDLYLGQARQSFEQAYGAPDGFHIMALLPGYLERGHSSLVAMAQDFILHSQSSLSGFYLNDYQRLVQVLAEAKETNRKTLLLGVSFGLLDFAEAYPNLDLSHCIIMETGGMKGRRKEIIRLELHDILKKAFRVKSIHSEYGMTELFSQAYSQGQGIYTPAKTMRILLREINDPFALVPFGKTGLINIIDLANIDTCSFIATDDIGRLHSGGQFEVLGRYDASDIRGCNLMVSDL